MASKKNFSAPYVEPKKSDKIKTEIDYHDKAPPVTKQVLDDQMYREIDRVLSGKAKNNVLIKRRDVYSGTGKNRKVVGWDKEVEQWVESLTEPTEKHKKQRPKLKH